MKRSKFGVASRSLLGGWGLVMISIPAVAAGPFKEEYLRAASTEAVIFS